VGAVPRITFPNLSQRLASRPSRLVRTMVRAVRRHHEGDEGRHSGDTDYEVEDLQRGRRYRGAS